MILMSKRKRSLEHELFDRKRYVQTYSIQFYTIFDITYFDV